AAGLTVTAGPYLLAIDDLRAFSRAVARSLTEVDVWLTPTLGEPPPRLGEMVATEADDEDDVPLLRQLLVQPADPIVGLVGRRFVCRHLRIQWRLCSGGDE